MVKAFHVDWRVLGLIWRLFHLCGMLERVLCSVGDTPFRRSFDAMEGPISARASVPEIHVVATDGSSCWCKLISGR